MTDHHQAGQGRCATGSRRRVSGPLAQEKAQGGVVPLGIGPQGRDLQHRILSPGSVFSAAKEVRDRALPAWVRSVRESNVIMIPRSGGGGQKVDSRRADEVFAEHGAGRFRKAGSVLAAF